MIPRIPCILFVLFSCVSTAQAALIELQNGDVLHAEIKKQTDTEITLEHPILGTITLNKEQITSMKIDPEEAEIVASADKTVSQDEPVINPGLFGSWVLQGWESSVNVGFNGAAGSSDNTNFRAEFSTKTEDEKHRWDFNMFFLYKQEDGKATDNKFQANLLKDWFINDSNWFYFTRGGFDWDQFKDWDYRIRLGGGSGYQFIKTKTVELSSRHGLNSTYSIYSDRQEFQLEALLGLDWSWVVSEQQSVTLTNTIYPALTDLGEFRNVTKFEWKHNIGYYNGLAIKLGFTNEYDTTESEKYDLKYYASLVWGL